MLRMDHVVVPIWDPAASLAFYREVMGFALINTYSGDDWGGFPWLMMMFSPGDGRALVLVHFQRLARPPTRSRATHGIWLSPRLPRARSSDGAASSMRTR